MIKKIIYSVLAVAGWCLACYLLGSFAAWGFSPSGWNSGQRFAVGSLAIGGSLVVVIAAWYHEDY